MLICDMILRKNFTTSGEFDTPSCGVDDVSQCPDQPSTLPIVCFNTTSLFQQNVYNVVGLIRAPLIHNSCRFSQLMLVPAEPIIFELENLLL